ncbi:cytoplasmic protein [Filimonas lacunae]|nr:cytoplasmic protein [Filimonas lacunae]
MHILQAFCRKNGMEEWSDTHVWPEVEEALLYEHGLLKLNQPDPYQPMYEGAGPTLHNITTYMLNQMFDDRVVDIIELCFRSIGREQLLNKRKELVYTYSPEQAVVDLNDRFQEHCIGYRFMEGYIIRIDNNWLYEEVAKPVFLLLDKPKFAAVNALFINAHHYLKKGNYPECIAAAAKAYKKTLQKVCEIRDVVYAQEEGMEELIDKLYQRYLLPDAMRGSLLALSLLLENRFVKPSQATFSVDMTATVIKLLVGMLEEEQL